MDGNYGQNQNWQNPYYDQPDSNQPYMNQGQPTQNWQNMNQSQPNQNWQNQGQPYQNWQNPNQGQPYPNGNYNGSNNYAPNNYNGPIVVSNAVPPKSGGLAVGSLVCGIISILGCWSVISFIISIVGVVLGIVNNAQDSPNKGMAVAGIILNIFGFILSIFFIVFWMAI